LSLDRKLASGWHCSSWQALRSRPAWPALGIIFEPIHFCDAVKVQQSVANFAYSRNTVFPAAICDTQKTQREKAASSPRASRPVAKDEADPWQIRHPG
jgi:hypothetical protein